MYIYDFLITLRTFRIDIWKKEQAIGVANTTARTNFGIEKGFGGSAVHAGCMAYPLRVRLFKGTKFIISILKVQNFDFFLVYGVRTTL